MERPAKRPRLITPLESLYNSNYNSQHAYFEVPDDEVDNYEEPEEGIDERVYDPDQELHLKRAQAEFKLKSTFEAIFEKYGKDFGGIGDEIDMRTGEILVNNGHLIQMRHERDAGESQTTLSEDLDHGMSGSEEYEMEGEEDDEDPDDGNDDDDDDEDGDEDDDEEDELGEEDEERDSDDEDPLSDEEMVEDDMILRGFAQASQHLFQRQPLHEPASSRDRFAACPELHHAAVAHARALPSKSEILAQFGPQLGPDIVEYMSKRKNLEENNSEPAWRAPDIEPPRRVPDIESAWRAPDIEPHYRRAAARRSLVKSKVMRPELEVERSASPENASSIWAITAPKSTRKSALRVPFSRDEDQLLLDFVADARRRGLDLSKISTWKQLEAMNSRRSAKGWRQRYNTKFTYLRTRSVDESDISTSDFSSGTAQIPHQRLDDRRYFARPTPPPPSRPVDAERPARIRKPAQRDGVISWSEAIATIALVDPEGNAGLLDDVRRTGYPLPYERPVPSMFSNRRHALDGSVPRRPVEQNQGFPLRPESQIDSLAGFKNKPAQNGSAFPTTASQADRAPCPHANCKSYATTLYRLERAYDEELSPMCSHLLYEHHMTPFPCGELNCEHKGAKGYFMQRDLVRHVKGAHPYASALHRLRGRVDPALLDQSSRFDQPRQSIEIQHNIVNSRHPRDSDFMASQRPHTSQGLSPSRKSGFGSGQDPQNTLTPRATDRAASESVSSLHVHPSSVRDRDMPSIDQREASSDSDVQILDENPFKKSESSKKDDAGASVDNRPEDRYNRVPAFNPSFTDTTSRGPRSGTNSNLPSNFPRENVISSPGNMTAYLEAQGNRFTNSSTPKEPPSKSHCSPPAIIPDSQDSPREIPSRPPFCQPQTRQASGTANSHKSSWHVENALDRSYEFSDEDDGIRPTIRKSQPQHSRPQNPLSVPQKFLPISTPPSSVPQTFFGSAPPIKIESPQTQVTDKRPSMLAKKGTSSSSQPTVSHSKQKSRKSAIHNVLASDEFDELSLDENGFILLSARPRSEKVPELDLTVQVKREEDGIPAGPAGTTKKRLFSSIEVDNEADELAEEGPSMSTLHQPGRLSVSKLLTKSTMRDSGLTSNRPIKKPKPRKKSSDRHVFRSQPCSSLQTPTTHLQFPATTGTPLLGLSNCGSAKDNETNSSMPEIPSTSELGSSPNPGRRNLNMLITPQKKTWVRSKVKVEEENDLNDSVVTPGGTLRRCGTDGFVCGRAFCFRCQAEDDSMMRS